MFAKEIHPDFDGRLPVTITVYRCTRQMPHYHLNTIETILCMKGEATVYTMHRRHNLRAGDIIQADMFDIHSVSSTKENLMASFHFDLEHPLFRDKGYDLLYYMCSSDETNQNRMHHINRMRMLLLALLTCYIRNADDRRIPFLTEKILEMTRNHFQYYNHIHAEDSMDPPEMMNRFERIVSYMLKHYAEKVTMRDICLEEHISYNYLSQFFKHSSLKTFRNFLHEIRVYHSEHLLLCYPDLSVPEISYRVGFSDPKLFYREFKRKHGHTPHQHRIWYRRYNEGVSPDLILPIPETMDQVEECIITLYTDLVYGMEIC